MKIKYKFRSLRKLGKSTILCPKHNLQHCLTLYKDDEDFGKALGCYKCYKDLKIKHEDFKKEAKTQSD